MAGKKAAWNYGTGSFLGMIGIDILVLSPLFDFFLPGNRLQWGPARRIDGRSSKYPRQFNLW